MENAIRFEPIGDDLYNIEYLREPTAINPKTPIRTLENICKKEPYNFEAAMELAKKYAEAGRYNDSCEVRFRAATEAINSIPEDEEYMELDLENPENQEFIEIITASGSDFYIHGDFEMAAALFESALSLDSQDHGDVTPQLALSYIAIDDWEGYEILKNDFTPGTMIQALVENFAAFRRSEKPQTKLPPELITEITSTEHTLDDKFLIEVEKDRVSKEVAARELWYRHMPIFEVFSEFTMQFK